MRSRALQVIILIALGVALGLLLTRKWRAAEPPPAVHVSTPAPARVLPPLPPEPPRAAAPPRAREFKLPKMPPPAPAPIAKASAEAREPLAKVQVPRFWELRGSSPQSYRLLSDHEHVMSGGWSAVIKSKPQSTAVTLDGGLVQTVHGDSLAGRRLEVSAFVRAEDVRAYTVAVSFTALDSDNKLLYTASSSADVPKVTSEWTRIRLVVDVPWSAAQVRYGVVLSGPGSVWVDDFRLTTVDPTVVALSSTTPPSQFGQPVTVAREVLHQPENLDFEEISDIPAPVDEKEASVTAIRQ
jgi:hypothetical protein